MIGGTTVLVGLLRDPKVGSLSPRMQNAAFAARALDYAYVPLGVPPEHTTLAEHERVDRPDPALDLVAEGDDGLLVRRRHVRAGEAEGDEAAHRLLEPLRRNPERYVCNVERERGECRVLHSRRERVDLRVAEQPDKRCRPADHRL